MSLIKNYSTEQIRDIIDDTPEYKEGVKLFAAYLASKGWSSRKMETLFDISFKQITIWIHEFDNNGVEGLKEKPKTGRNSKLNEIQKNELRKILSESSPQDFGIHETKWIGDAVRLLIEKRYGISYKKAQVYNIVNSLNIENSENNVNI